MIWQYYIGDALFVATLIAKNWRIYRIFYNKEFKQRVIITIITRMIVDQFNDMSDIQAMLQ